MCQFYCFSGQCRIFNQYIINVERILPFKKIFFFVNLFVSTKFIQPTKMPLKNPRFINHNNNRLWNNFSGKLVKKGHSKSLHVM